MKTKRDISVPLVFIMLGITLFFSAFFSDSFSETLVGKIYLSFTVLIILLGVLKIEQIEIEQNTLTKTTFIFKRRIKLNSIKKYIVKAHNMNSYSQYNIAAILKFLKNGKRYSNFRLLTIYPEGKRTMKIDERTMTVSDFTKVLNEIKKGKKNT